MKKKKAKAIEEDGREWMGRKGRDGKKKKAKAIEEDGREGTKSVYWLAVFL